MPNTHSNPVPRTMAAERHEPARSPSGAMSDRILSVSTAPYDGHPMPTALESLALVGATHVEPAYIVGYTEPFDESAFLPNRVVEVRRQLAEAGLGCHAVSTHIDLGLPDAVEVFTHRMAFAAGVGARIVCTNAAARSREAAFMRNVEPLLRRAEGFGLVIALENPGDGSDNLVNTAIDGLDLIRRLGSPHVGLNYDAANTASHRPHFGNVADDAIRALPASAHAHIKDVRRTEEGWFFTPVNKGGIGCERILAALPDWPNLPVSIEVPLRLHRGPDAQPIRQPKPVPLPMIEEALMDSLRTVRQALGGL